MCFYIIDKYTNKHIIIPKFIKRYHTAQDTDGQIIYYPSILAKSFNILRRKLYKQFD